MKSKGKGQKAKVQGTEECGASVRRAPGACAFRALALAFYLLPFAFCLLSVATARAQYGRPLESNMPQGGRPEVLKEVGIEQRLNEQVPLDIQFRDETGRTVTLGDYFKDGKPVLLSLVYYECPMLCNLVLNGEVGMMEALKFTAGREYNAVTISFDARETPELAAKKKATYMKRYGRTGADWHFLTGDEASIKRLTQAVGFRFKWDEQSSQFAHASAIMILTPQGKLSHYFYGIEFAPKDVRLGLVEASAGRVGSPVDELLLFCYHYDPTTGKFVAVRRIVQGAGVLTVCAMAAFIFALQRRVKRREMDEPGETVNVGGTA